MRMLKLFALVAVVVGLAAAGPVHAQCVRILDTTAPDGSRSYIFTEGYPYVCLPGYHPGDLTGSPAMYDPFSIYWQLGQYDPALGLGIDAGANTVPPGTWLAPSFVYPPFTFAYLLEHDWSNSDGCMTPGVCECVLMTDHSDGVGYFAIHGGLTNAGGDLYLNLGGTMPNGSDGSDCSAFEAPIVLTPMPKPYVTRADLNQDTMDTQFTVTVDAPVDGVYTKNGCACGPAQYVVYEQALPAGSPAPVSRNVADGWRVASAATPIGTAAVYTSDICNAPDVDVYVAAALVFDASTPTSTLTSAVLSANADNDLGAAFQLNCGTNLAEPKPLAPRNRRQIERPERKR